MSWSSGSNSTRGARVDLPPSLHTHKDSGLRATSGTRRGISTGDTAAPTRTVLKRENLEPFPGTLTLETRSSRGPNDELWTQGESFPIGLRRRCRQPLHSTLAAWTFRLGHTLPPFSQDARSRALVLGSVPLIVFAAIQHPRFYPYRTSQPPGTLRARTQLPFFHCHAKSASHGIFGNRLFDCEYNTRSPRWYPSVTMPTTSDSSLDSPTRKPYLFLISIWPLSTARFVYVTHAGRGQSITLLEVYLFVCVGVRLRKMCMFMCVWVRVHADFHIHPSRSHRSRMESSFAARPVGTNRPLVR